MAEGLRFRLSVVWLSRVLEADTSVTGRSSFGCFTFLWNGNGSGIEREGFLCLFPLHGTGNPGNFLFARGLCVWWKEQVQRSLVYISFPLGLWMQANRSDKEVENSRHCPGCLYRAFLECLWQILKQISSNIFPSLLQLWCQENLKILVLMDKQKRIVVTERKKPIRSTTYLHDRSTEGRKTLLRDFEMQDITWCKDCA